LFTNSLIFKKLGKNISVAFAGSILLAFISQFYIPLPFTPIPISLQTIGIFLIGGLMGPLESFLCVVLYLLEGTIGLPVFAGGLSKPLWFFASTAGFLFSFLFTTPLISAYLQKNSREKWHYIFLVLTLAQSIMFIFGAGWLSFSLGLKKALLVGVVPFLVGAFLKIFIGVLILKLLFSFNYRIRHDY
jgi:biotin transport system substrate-specific component